MYMYVYVFNEPVHGSTSSTLEASDEELSVEQVMHVRSYSMLGIPMVVFLPVDHFIGPKISTVQWPISLTMESHMI